MNQTTVDRVRAALNAAGVPAEVIELETSTRTAEEAAAACGVTVGQIVKSLVFLAGGDPILVLTSGKNQVDERRLETYTGKPVRRATADTVREVTGFAIGGVAPVGHRQRLRVVIDADLLEYDRLFAAAGTPRAVVALTPQELCQLTAGEVRAVKRQAPVDSGARP